MSIRKWAVGAFLALIINVNLAHAAVVTSTTKYNFGTLNAKITITQGSLLSPAEQKELVCASLNIYHEARGTTYNNKLGVVWVVKNRMKIKNQSACEIIYARNSSKGQPQFSWTGYRHKSLLDKQSWDDAQQIAYAVLFADSNSDITKGSTHFHEKHVLPAWSAKSRNKVILGSHVFVRVESYLQAVQILKEPARSIN